MDCPSFLAFILTYDRRNYINKMNDAFYKQICTAIALKQGNKNLLFVVYCNLYEIIALYYL